MGLRSLLKRAGGREREANDSPNVDEAEVNEILEALQNGINNMRSSGVDLVVLEIADYNPDSKEIEIQPYEGKPGAEYIMVSGAILPISHPIFSYYPYETLSGEEQRFVQDEKTYLRTALVLEDIGDLKKFPSAGVEIYERLHVVPMLCRLKPEAPWHYFNVEHFYREENLRAFAKEAAEHGWTKEGIEDSVNNGVIEWRRKTRKLFERSEAYNTLKGMGESGLYSNS